MKKTIAALILGSVLGIVGARYLFVGSWLNLIPWGIAGLAIGSLGSKNEAFVNGVTYGFVLVFVFMIAGYTGTYSLASRLPFFAFLGVVGSVCGLLLGLIGFYIKSRLVKKKG